MNGTDVQKFFKASMPYFDTISVILSWYAANIGTLLLNKIVHGLSYVPEQKLKSKMQGLKIAVLAVVFCGSILAGNASLKFLPISFNQMIGATTPFFTALLAFIIVGEVERFETYVALVPVVVGVMISSYNEPSFHLIGLIICFSSTCARALKSVLQGLLMSNSNEKLDSVNLLRFMAPMSVVLLIPLTLLMEDTSQIMAFFNPEKNEHFRRFIVTLAFNSFAAFSVNLLNFMVTKRTNALTLQVLGNAKGVVATFISILIFKNQITLLGIVGYGITLVGVALYSQYKLKK